MARYMKGSIGNTWDRWQDDDETPQRPITIAPDPDEVLIKRYVMLREQYWLWRAPHMADDLNRIARELRARGITELPERVA